MRSWSFYDAGTAIVVRILRIAKELRRHPMFGYAMAFVAVGVATLLQWLIRGQYAGSPFLTIYPAIIVSTLIGGLGPGLLSAVLSGVSQWSLFIPVLRVFAVMSYAFDATLCVLLIVFINKTFEVLLVDIGREKQAMQHQHLLTNELHHRIQNLLTVMQAVIQFSLPGEGMIAEAAIRQRLMNRLQSMAAANRAITDSMGDGVRLLDLIGSEIRGFEAKFDISGPAGIVLGPHMTQNLALILHELLTNTLKYGALSIASGWVGLRLEWTTPVFTLTWQEHDGPPVKRPTSSGFGSRILGTLPKSFSDKVEIGYDESGLRYMLQIQSDEIRCLDFTSRNAPAKNVATALEPDMSETGPSAAWLAEQVELTD